MVVTLEGTELVVTSRGDGVDWEAHDISGPLMLNEWNVDNHALTLHSGMAGRVGEVAATGEENRSNAAESSSTEFHDFLDEIIARASWCMGAGATKDQIACWPRPLMKWRASTISSARNLKCSKPLTLMPTSDVPSRGTGMAQPRTEGLRCCRTSSLSAWD